MTDAHILKPSSRKLCILWAIALTLLLALGAFCWLTVVPLWQAHVAVSDFQETRITGAATVKRLGGPELCFRKVRTYLKCPGLPRTKKNWSVALLGYCGREAVPTLTAHLAGEDHDLAVYAAKALGRIGPDAEEAVPALLTSLDHPGDGRRLMAAIALGQIGTGASAAAAALEEVARNDLEPQVRKAAAEALEKIKAAEQQQAGSAYSLRPTPITASNSFNSPTREHTRQTFENPLVSFGESRG